MKPDSIVGAVCGMIFRAIFVIAAVYLIYRGTGICYDYGYRIFAEPAVSSGEGRIISVTTTEEMDPFEMGELMEKKGLVRDGRLFGLQYYCSEYRKDVKPGTYELSTAMTAEEMFGVMAADTKEKDAGEEEDT